MLEQNPDLESLHERVSDKVKRHWNKMHLGERSEFVFKQDFHGDMVYVTIVKSHRVNEINFLKISFRGGEVVSRGNFNVKRDLKQVISGALMELGL